MATSWHSNKFLNPVSDGVVLPVLHLNGFKIANPTVLARDVVLGCAGDVPTVEVLAAADLLRTTTTPFDMAMLNDIDRYHLVMDVIDRVPGLGTRFAGLRQEMSDARWTLVRIHQCTATTSLP